MQFQLTESQSKSAVDAAASYKVQSELHPKDFMLRAFLDMDAHSGVEHYFNSGQADALKLVALMKRLGLDPSKARVLEFAAGYGRVTRHMSKFCDLVASDIHPAAVDMTKAVFGVDAHQSSEDPKTLQIPGGFDFIFVLSLFSHLPDATFGDWLSALLSLLKPDGYLMFTTHGPRSVEGSPGLPPIGSDGIGFITGSDQKDLDGQVYGSSIVDPYYVARKILEAKGRLVSYQEIAWWNLQDEYLIQQR